MGWFKAGRSGAATQRHAGGRVGGARAWVGGCNHAPSRRSRCTPPIPVPSDIALVLVDEVHLLNEDRGATLEVGVVSRIKMVARLPEMRAAPIAGVRFVAVRRVHARPPPWRVCGGGQLRGRRDLCVVAA